MELDLTKPRLTADQENTLNLRDRMKRRGSQIVIDNMTERAAISLAHRTARRFRFKVKTKILPHGVQVTRVDEARDAETKPNWHFEVMAIGDSFTVDFRYVAALRTAASRAGKSLVRRFVVTKTIVGKATCSRAE